MKIVSHWVAELQENYWEQIEVKASSNKEEQAVNPMT
jgi:hypothetical protein